MKTPTNLKIKSNCEIWLNEKQLRGICDAWIMFDADEFDNAIVVLQLFVRDFVAEELLFLSEIIRLKESYNSMFIWNSITQPR